MIARNGDGTVLGVNLFPSRGFGNNTEFYRLLANLVRYRPGFDEQDCQPNGAPDVCELLNDPSLDCDGNGMLDECEMPDPSTLGACCHMDGSCTIDTAANCVSPSVYQGDCVACAVDTCLICNDEPVEADCGLPVDTVNGGCNSTPFATVPIACGQTFCGSSAFDGSLRDTDWYQIVLPEETQITWSGRADFDLVLIVIDSSNGTNCLAPILVESAVGNEGELVLLSTCLPAGTYELFVAPDFTDVKACGSDYRVTVSCELCPQPE
jgi:hypothetical protein